MFDFGCYTDINRIGKTVTETELTDAEFIVREIERFRKSRRRKDMINGERYYKGQQDILCKQRTAIGENGELEVITNLPNNRICDNQYRKMVEQKTNYLVGQPFVLTSEDNSFIEALGPYIQTKYFFRLLREVTRDALNCGIGWMYPAYGEDGRLQLRRIKPYEIIPEWVDSEHSRLEAAIRIYQTVSYEAKTEKIIDHVEVFDTDGVYYFLLDGGTLHPEGKVFEPYFTVADYTGEAIGYHWDRIPLIAFKYNADEIPLIKMCKSLQDGLNSIESAWQDQMEENPHNTIMVLLNYDGENLGEFRKNLATYSVVKVRSADGVPGDLRTLQVEVNSENYKAVIEQFKKAIIENCMGYDAKDDRLGGNANEMNIASMYSDIELDTNGMEEEYQAAFEELIWFLICHIANTGGRDFEGTKYEIVFKKFMMLNESEAIQNIRNSVGILSNATLIANHPWVTDVQAELDKLEAEREKSEADTWTV